MRSLRLSIGLVTLLAFECSAQQLVINEISQGTGAKEYVEFLVMGNPTCQTPVPCLDLRGYVIDDNNGDFASGSGTGIASGAVRFANDPFWSCIPQGTLIVVYNNADINPALPPDDLSMSDGNCTLIIPVNSTLFEGQSSSPTSSVSTYPSTGWIVGGGTWNQIAMSNTNDSFQTRASISSPGSLHSVSWGNNTNGAVIYFSAASGSVFSMTNGTGIDPTVQSNWTEGAVGVDETPGQPNNTANGLWIGSMNPDCGAGNPLTVVASSTPTGCGTGCSGTLSVQITGGVAPYTIVWTNGANTANVSNVCAGNYLVSVTDAGGCSDSDITTVTSVVNDITIQLNPTDESCSGGCNGQIVALVSGSGGPYNFSWSNGANSSTNSNLCPGNYTLTVTSQAGCVASETATINAGTSNLALQVNTTSESCAGACDGSVSATVSGSAGPFTYAWSNGANSAAVNNLCPGNYNLTVTDPNGCTATSNGTVNAGGTGQPVTILTSGPFTTSDSPVQFQADLNGGLWSSDCGTCMTGSGVFDPSTVTPGTYQICYTLGAGACQSTDCQSILVTQGCVTQTSAETVNICPGTSVIIEGQSLSAQGDYPFTYTDVLGCDSIHTVQLSWYPVQPIHNFVSLCEGDSTEIAGTWYSSVDLVNWTSIDGNGCVSNNSTSITMEDCNIEPYTVFIPNAFTPNHDLVNDLFTVVISGGLLKEGYILNRWGEVVHVFDENNTTWDGRTQHGLDAPDGVYTYIVIAEQTGSIRHEYQGFVTIMR